MGNDVEQGSARAAELRDLAVDVAREAGALLREHASRLHELTVEHKTSATDPVSEADRQAEALIVQRLLDARPDDGILGEEDADNRPGTSGLCWVIDPLDGTVNFLYGIPQWCVSIAVRDEVGPLAGVVYDPNLDEVFAAARGHGATLGQRPLQVSGADDLSGALVATGFAYDPDVRRDQGALASGLLEVARDLRRAGAAALDLAWVAAGRLDAYLEYGLAPWDWAAGSLLVTEAGGAVTHLTTRLGGADRDGLLAAPPACHDAFLDWLDRSRWRVDTAGGTSGEEG